MEHTTANTSCKNCGYTYEGNFCPRCGQKSATHEIDSRFIFHEIPHAIFHVDKGIFFTLKEMSIRPGKTVLDYINGKRIRHFSPIAYIIILSSIFLFVNSLYTNHVDQVKVITSNDHLQEKLIHMLGFIFLSFTPVFAFVYWLFFRSKSHFNYWQFLVASTFFIGHSIVIMLIARIVSPSSFGASTLQGIVLTPLFFYLVFCYFQMLQSFYKSKVGLVIKLSIALFISIMFCAFVFVGFVVITERILR